MRDGDGIGMQAQKCEAIAGLLDVTALTDEQEEWRAPSSNQTSQPCKEQL